MASRFDKKQCEAELAMQLRAMKIPHKTQYRFHEKRMWRFDFAFPEIQLAVEVQGVTNIQFHKGKPFIGGHQSPQGMKNDLEKFDEAMRLGWRVYQCEQQMVSSGRALQTIEILLGRARISEGRQRALKL